MEFFDIVLGCSFGDEGKGKVVYDLLSQTKYDLCVRFNGGSNAGHTVYVNEEKLVLHQLPIGTLFSRTNSLISSDALIDIDKLSLEIAKKIFATYENNESVQKFEELLGVQFTLPNLQDYDVEYKPKMNFIKY